MGSLVGSILSAKAYVLMILLQFGYAGMYIIAVFSLKHGMNHYVLVVYRNISAVIFLAPFAYWFERKSRPKMTIRIFLKITLLALLEPVLDQNCYYVGAKLTSASFSTALFNMLPAITFLLAVVLRMETIKMKSIRTQAKIVGTLVTVAGALLMILYQGPNLQFPWTRGRAQVHEETQIGGDFIKGTLMLIFACFCWAAFFILQTNTLESYPAEMSLAVLICSMGAVEGAAVTLVFTRGLKPWMIGWDIRLITSVYSGVMCSAIAYYVQGIVAKERGPVFITAFNPLCMIIVAILGSFILSENISLGMVVGAVIIVSGLYMLIWGKSKEHLTNKLDVEKSAVGINSSTLELPTSISPLKKNNSMV